MHQRNLFISPILAHRELVIIDFGQIKLYNIWISIICYSVYLIGH